MDNQEPELVLLTTAFDSNMASIIMSKLEANGIPAIVKNIGAGGLNDIILGRSIGTMEIYVPENLLEDAKVLLQVDEDYVPEKYEETKKSNTFLNILFYIIIIIVIIGIALVRNPFRF